MLWIALFLYYLKAMPDFFHWRFGERKRRKWNNTKNQPLHVCFISYNARIRECKLAYAAKLCGIKVTLITHSSNLMDNFDNYFDEIYIVQNPWKCLMQIDRIKPDVIHLFVNYTVSRLLPVLFFSRVPVVYDPYDCIKGMFKRKFKLPWFEEFAEKLCFQKADHLCARSLEPLYLKRKFKYILPSSTYFPDYSWKPPALQGRKIILEDSELHVVYAGGIANEDRYPKKYFGFSQYIDVGRALAKQKIHLHLYPANPIGQDQFKNYYSLYYKEAEKNPYFHIYERVTHTKLMDKMRRYDVGLHIFGIGINHDDCFSISRAKAEYSTAAKLFDYLELDLPVLIHNGFHQRGIIRHYGRTISVDNIYDVRKSLVECLKKQKTAKKEDFYLDVQAFRLKNMYSTL